MRWDDWAEPSRPETQREHMRNKMKGRRPRIRLNDMCARVKALASGAKTWVHDPSSLKRLYYIGALITLVVIAVQVSIARLELDTARADLEARTRPYLSIESMRVEDEGDYWITVTIEINNLGEIPATRVQLEEIVFGGSGIAWRSQPSDDRIATNRTAKNGVIISAEGMIVVPMRADFPDDMIFFQQKPTAVDISVQGTVWRGTITDGSVIDIGLVYYWGERQYWYVATAVQSNGEWTVVMERGD